MFKNTLVVVLVVASICTLINWVSEVQAERMKEIKKISVKY